jgi:hypothetical protein
MKPPLALVTTSKFHYEQYLIKYGLSVKNTKQVSILKDVLGFEFSGIEMLDESSNVTDYVISKIKVV